MLEGVLGPGGTATGAAIPGYELAGKTGTANKATRSRRLLGHKYVASFVGFAPADKPGLLVSVMVDEPRARSTAAWSPGRPGGASPFALNYLQDPA